MCVWIQPDHRESHLTTASALRDGARCKHFTATFQTHRGRVPHAENPSLTQTSTTQILLMVVPHGQSEMKVGFGHIPRKVKECILPFGGNKVISWNQHEHTRTNETFHLQTWFLYECKKQAVNFPIALHVCVCVCVHNNSTTIWPHSAVHLWTLPTGMFNEHIYSAQ